MRGQVWASEHGRGAGLGIQRDHRLGQVSVVTPLRIDAPNSDGAGRRLSAFEAWEIISSDWIYGDEMRDGMNMWNFPIIA